MCSPELYRLTSQKAYPTYGLVSLRLRFICFKLRCAACSWAPPKVKCTHVVGCNDIRPDNTCPQSNEVHPRYFDPHPEKHCSIKNHLNICKLCTEKAQFSHPNLAAFVSLHTEHGCQNTQNSLSERECKLPLASELWNTWAKKH